MSIKSTPFAFFLKENPKKKRVGKYTGMTDKYKKAIVKLAEGNSINFD